MKWKKAVKTIFGVMFVIIGFFILTTFFYFIPFSPADKLTVWVWIMLAVSMFGFGVSIFLRLDVKKTIGVLAFVILWTLIFFAPIPSSVQELVWAVWLFFPFYVLYIWRKYQESKRKQAHNV
jgi:hypothetical protein